ncbi:MAG TPA: helix-hairpin-helix domain-containing protein, partial [Pirellulaceae bacterium]|nr:helix-hairpin-helix domain-containing protein [Pirellulaceae bacterium]
ALSPSLETPSDSPPSAPPESTSALPAGRLFEPPTTPVAAPLAAASLKRKKKKKKKVIGEHAFKDYYNYVEPLGRVPPHRVLAINRGERAHAIRVKIEADADAMLREAEQFLIFLNHPHGEFIFNCVRDSLFRLIIPSLEREIRREMTERSEEHAVDVFIRNLRKLLLQPPTRSTRLLAIDPGFKSGSKMVALDEFGNVLGHGMIFVIGKDEERRKKTRARLADMVKQHNVSVIAIGNGTGCRETEQLVADCLADELKDRDVAYVIVNEAGASIYSTSPLGREELPQFDALQRGAISIGRRLLDPLSEMVKIHPANLGVGLYQHDIKAKHLKDSLDAVVESCVNFVGVDVNSASPALLRYVSGMNALTARRVYEHRREKGPFKNREELKLVAGFGDQTFVQAAGFLKVIGGENPLDATWIHPESYDIARRVLDKLGCDVGDLAKTVPGPAKEEPKREFGAELAKAEGTGDQEQETRQEPGVRSQAPRDGTQGLLFPELPESTEGHGESSTNAALGVEDSVPGMPAASSHVEPAPLPEEPNAPDNLSTELAETAVLTV